MLALKRRLMLRTTQESGSSRDLIIQIYHMAQKKARLCFSPYNQGVNFKPSVCAREGKKNILELSTGPEVSFFVRKAVGNISAKQTFHPAFY